VLPSHCYTIAAINHIQPEFDVQQWGLREDVLALHIDNLLDLCPGINGGHYWLGLGGQIWQKSQGRDVRSRGITTHASDCVVECRTGSVLTNLPQSFKWLSTAFYSF